MSRLVLVLIAFIVIVVGGMALLAGRAGERPVAPIEKSVALGNLA